MTDKQIEELKAEIAELKKVAYEAADIQAIRKLQHQYGYYLDKCLYQQVVDLFDENGTIVFFGGIYRGKPGLKRLYLDRFRKTFTGGRNGPIRGYLMRWFPTIDNRFLLDHIQLQDVVDVSPDRSHAKARFRCFMQAGMHKSQPKIPHLSSQWWEHGIYENEYIRDPKTGQWKIWWMNYRPQYHADFETGWANTRPNYVPFMTKTFPEDPTGPDELVEHVYLWPDTEVVPFHYAHPITGEQLTADELAAPEKKA